MYVKFEETRHIVVANFNLLHLETMYSLILIKVKQPFFYKFIPITPFSETFYNCKTDTNQLFKPNFFFIIINNY